MSGGGGGGGRGNSCRNGERRTIKTAGFVCSDGGAGVFSQESLRYIYELIKRLCFRILIF